MNHSEQTGLRSPFGRITQKREDTMTFGDYIPFVTVMVLTLLMFAAAAATIIALRARRAFAASALVRRTAQC